MSETVIITGGAGFLGSHLSERLLDEWEVICLDNLSTGTKENIDSFRDRSDFKFIQTDVKTDLTDQLSECFSSLDDIVRVYHLASRASPDDFEKYPLEIAWTSAKGTYNVLELCRQADARLLLTSTSEVYGNPKVHPQPESYNGNVDMRGARACYDEGKRFSETLAVTFADEYNIDVRTVRPFNTYGPRMRQDDGRVIPNFLTQALNNEPITVYGDGSQTRSFLYVSDQIRGMCRLMDKRELGGEVINIGSTNEMTVLELAELVVDLVNTDSEIVHHDLPAGDPERRQPDISKAKKMLDWEQRIDFEEGLMKTIKYFKNNGS